MVRLVLPEDDHNRKLANGFTLDASVATGRIQILPVAGGWMKVLDAFESDYAQDMNKFPGRSMVLLIDFDGRDDRLNEAKKVIPDSLLDRVFVLGVWKEPKDLPFRLGSSFEDIGMALARDCREGKSDTWDHEQLRHNEAELERLRLRVRPLLFQ